jgi:hypothetical protein
MTTPKLLGRGRLADLMSEVPSQAWVNEVMAHIAALEHALRDSHAGANGTRQMRIKAMEQHISDLEKSLENARKALVRARNDGLEKAAARARRAGEHQCDPYQFRCTEDWQERIDGLPDDILALKEPEE